MNKEPGQHLGVLDGFRGLLAFWVMAGHLMPLFRVSFSWFDNPGWAVDLFMFLSGFLLAWHWRERARVFSSPWGQVGDFFIRRFFRIIPLYLPMLAVALYLQPNSTNLTWPSLLLHLTLLSGILPLYASNDLLPDWSLSLEMQFYLLFPLLMLLGRRAGAIILLFVGVMAMQVAQSNLLFYDNDHGPIHHFGTGELGIYSHPSLIFFRLPVFMAGMLLADLLISQREGEPNRMTALLFYALLIGYALLPSPSAVQHWAVFMAILLVVETRLSGAVLQVFSCRVARFMGDVSYAVYLVHLLVFAVLLPVLQKNVLVLKSPANNATLALLLVTPVVYGSAYILHRLIEWPGIELGRKLARYWRNNVEPRSLASVEREAAA